MLIKIFTGQSEPWSRPQRDLGRGEWQKWRNCMVLKLTKSRQWRQPCSSSLIETVTKSSPNTGPLFPLSCEYLDCALTWCRAVGKGASGCAAERTDHKFGVWLGFGAEAVKGIMFLCPTVLLHCLSAMITICSTYMQLSSSNRRDLSKVIVSHFWYLPTLTILARNIMMFIFGELGKLWCEKGYMNCLLFPFRKLSDPIFWSYLT